MKYHLFYDFAYKYKIYLIKLFIFIKSQITDMRVLMKHYLLYLFTTIIFFSYSPAHAYLDPGTGSIILQAILGFIAASIATVSFYWTKVKFFFSKFFKKKVNEDKIDQ